jgi:hypothetical protein
MATKLWNVVCEGSLWFVGGIMLCLLHYQFFPDVGGYACRWDGECAGWTRGAVVESAFGSLGYWWAYTMISTGILRLHPAVSGMRESRATILLTWAFILTCGGKHLLDAYSNFNPIYDFLNHYTIVTAPISDVAVIFVLAGLIRVFERVSAARAELERRAAMAEQGD